MKHHSHVSDWHGQGDDVAGNDASQGGDTGQGTDSQSSTQDDRGHWSGDSGQGGHGDDSMGGSDAAAGGHDGTDVSVIQLTDSAATVTGTAGEDKFVVHGLDQQGDVINGFTLGQDHLVIHDKSVAPGDLADHLSLVAGTDGTNVVVDAGTASEHILATLTGVETDDLSAVLGGNRVPPSIIQIGQSGETVAGTSGEDKFIVHSLAQHDDVITNFTLGQDVLHLPGHHDAHDRLSVAPDSENPGSTDVIVDAGTDHEHVLVTLQDVIATDLDQLLHKSTTVATSSTSGDGSSTSTDNSASMGMDNGSSTATDGSSSTTGGTSSTATDGTTTTSSTATDGSSATTTTTDGSSSSTGTSTDAASGSSTATGTTTDASTGATTGDTASATEGSGSSTASTGSTDAASGSSDASTASGTIKTADLTDNAGHDIFVFSTIPTEVQHIQDFHPGEDIIDFAPVLKAAGYTGDLVSDGLLHTVADGTGTDIMLGDVKMVTIDHVTPDQLHATDYWH